MSMSESNQPVKSTIIDEQLISHGEKSQKGQSYHLGKTTYSELLEHKGNSLKEIMKECNQIAMQIRPCSRHFITKLSLQLHYPVFQF